MISLSLIIKDSKSRIGEMRLYCSQCPLLVQTGTRAYAKATTGHGFYILSLYNLIINYCVLYGFMFYSFTTHDVSVLSVLPVLLSDFVYGFMFYDISVLPILSCDVLYGLMFCEAHFTSHGTSVSSTNRDLEYSLNLNDVTVYCFNLSDLLYFKSSDKCISVICVCVLPIEISPTAMIPHLFHSSEMTSTLKQSLTHTH
uniref:Uncharacterized protein n=1 Tax=Cacopsylla melanoneura TaxID=428564 RepID=A0A8D8UGX2_9HEMI